jgi:hypothetical protein
LTKWFKIFLILSHFPIALLELTSPKWKMAKSHIFPLPFESLVDILFVSQLDTTKLKGFLLFQMERVTEAELGFPGPENGLCQSKE